MSIALNPVENQLAYKVMALYRDYGSHQTSTRYRDLYDAGQIINQLPIDPDALDRALVIQQQRRNTTLPEDLADPEPEWAESYNKAATARMAGAQPPFTDYETAVTTVRTQISPPLGRVAGQEARHSITQIETNTPRAPHPNHDRREADPTRYRPSRSRIGRRAMTPPNPGGLIGPTPAAHRRETRARVGRCVPDAAE